MIGNNIFGSKYVTSLQTTYSRRIFFTRGADIEQSKDFHIPGRNSKTNYLQNRRAEFGS
jgi:hypothetical protein